MRRGRNQLAAFAALACIAAPSAALETPGQQQPGIKFYFSVPLDAAKKEQTLAAGFAIQGRREYETVHVDSRMINHFLGGGIEAKWIVGGVVAAGAIAAVASRDKSTTQSYQQQQQAQAQQIEQQKAQQTTTGGGGTCPVTVTPTCPK